MPPDDAANGGEPKREAGGFEYRGGKGYSPRTESGLTLLKEQRMINRVMNAKRPDGQRWQTEMTPRELAEHNRTVGDLTFKQQALAAAAPALALMFNLDSISIKKDDGTEDKMATLAIKATIMRSGLLASKVVVNAEKQNQDDDHLELKLEAMSHNADALSAAAAEQLIDQLINAVRGRIGDESADEVRDQLMRSINLDLGTVGTTITPDMEAAAMDASVCGE